MTRRLVFATNNAHKLEEVRAILGDVFEIVSLSDLGITEDIAETATTLQGNARIKARYVYEKTGLNCFADDTGLEVMALNGEPGVYSARYAGPEHDSAANVKKLLENMQDKADRRASFKTVIVLIEGVHEFVFEGEIKGQIAHNKTGMNGFGYDPVFIPEGYSQSFAELNSAVKNSISHRALAVKKLVEYLKK